MRRTLLLLAGLLMAFAPAPLPKPNPADDQKAIQGTWQLVSCTWEGREDDTTVSTLEVKGNRWTFRSADSSWRSTFIVSCSWKRRPWFYDGHSEKKPVTSMEGIYKIEGDTLTICYITDEEVRQDHVAIRPLDFDGGKPCRYLDVFAREKP